MSAENSDATAGTPASYGWSSKSIRIGRVVLEDVAVSSHEGALHLNNALSLLLEKTRRQSPGRQSRFAEPLPANTAARLLSLEAADFLEDMKRRHLAPATVDNQRRVLRLLLLASGDIPVSDISASHIREFWDILRWWPSNVGSYKKFKGLTDQQILEAGKRSNRRPPSRSTVDGAKRFLATFFNRLLRMRVIAYSPIEAFGDIKDDLVETGKRRPFNQHELCVLFDHTRFVPWAAKYPHRWWAPMLALYTGARASEIGQLKLTDIVCEEGVWCIAFQKTIDLDLAGDPNARTRQRLKGRSSIRTIPIAQPLLDAGFLDFMEDAKKVKHARLFPHLAAGVSKKTGDLNGVGYGRELTAQLSRFLKKEHGLDKGVVFHAFRHLFVTSLEEVGVSKELIATMTGHTIKKTVPVLETHYLHVSPGLLRQRQVDALAKFNPGVQLPQYRKGQFAKAYGADARLHP